MTGVTPFPTLDVYKRQPSGESIARQFLYGQRFTREHFGYTSDCFWLPDTFGYNAALPQILRECGVKYFCTTKIGWNDLNKFPVDSFVWRGMDLSLIHISRGRRRHRVGHAHCRFWRDAGGAYAVRAILAHAAAGERSQGLWNTKLTIRH